MVTSRAGLLPTLCVLLCVATPGAPGLLPNPFEGLRGWTLKLPDFGDWFDLPKQATNFFDKFVPVSIKNFLNFDPVPDWVPHPQDFNDFSSPKRNETERMLADESQSDDDLLELSSHEEKGNLHGYGRDVLRSLADQFNITEGLDTDKNFFSGFINGFKDQVKAIFPGTQWCGDGNIARSKKDLGFFFKTDSCCREHDNCPDFMIKDELKHGLINKGLFTRSSCECDKKFYACLKSAKDMISPQIGMAYFSVLGPQCFKFEYPIVECRIRIGLTNRCVDYELNNSSEKIYQWFDNPEF